MQQYRILTSGRQLGRQISSQTSLRASQTFQIESKTQSRKLSHSTSGSSSLSSLNKSFNPSSSSLSTLRKFSTETNPQQTKILSSLQEIVGPANVSTAAQVREQHGKDESHYSSMKSDFVCFPGTTEQVSKIVKFCYDNDIPVTPFGTGTGLEGGVNSMSGGVTVALTRMDKVVEVNEADFDCTVEAAVTWRDLNQHLSGTGLFFPVDPGASASLGGMASTNASGTNAVFYGTMKENVINLEVVLPSGEIVYTAGKLARPRKSAAGLNLTELFVGAEGLLGIITKVTLRLYPIPETMCTCICHFDEDKKTIETVIELIQNTIPLSRIEYIDAASMGAANAFSKGIEWPEKPSLFLDVCGNQTEVEPIIELVKEILESNGGTGFRYSSKNEERSKLWKARHELYYACRASRPGHNAIITDVCVPISRLTDIILKMRELVSELNINGYSFGHVGDGNFHSVITYDEKDPDEIRRVWEATEKIAEEAIRLGGTCTGEHGIGRGKMTLLEKQFDSNTIALMKTIKRAVDPKLLFNPGKVINMQ